MTDVSLPGGGVAPQPETRPLADLPAGARGVVQRVGGARAVRRRLLELGLVPGTPVRVVNVAPLGDPLELEVRAYRLSIRCAEAAVIRVASVSVPKRSLKVVG